MSAVDGRCLCGAVRITARDPKPAVSACHCSMCRRWSGSAFMGFVAPADGVTVEGPVKTYASSTFAERAWCDRCGSNLWFRDIGKDYELSPGLFEVASDFPLTREVYADQAMRACRFAGDHQRVTRAEYEQRNLFVEGDAP